MIPILMYHRIGSPDRKNRSKGQYTPPKMFARQIKYLFEHGYQTVSIRDLINYDEQQNYKVAFSTKKGISNIRGFTLPRIDINKDKILPVFIYLLWQAGRRK